MNQLILSLEIIILGILVLLSYYYIPRLYNINIMRLWFDVPKKIIPFITFFMLCVVV